MLLLHLLLLLGQSRLLLVWQVVAVLHLQVEPLSTDSVRHRFYYYFLEQAIIPDDITSQLRPTQPINRKKVFKGLTLSYLLDDLDHVFVVKLMILANFLGIELD